MFRDADFGRLTPVPKDVALRLALKLKMHYTQCYPGYWLFGGIVKVNQLLGTACLVLVSNASANLLTNPSFESGGFVNQGGQTMILPSGSTAITDWTVIGDELAWISAGNPYSLSAQDGDRFLDLTAFPAGAPFGGVSQDVTLVAGDFYVSSFFVGLYTQRWGGPPVSITASAGGSTATFSVTMPSMESTWTPFSMYFCVFQRCE